MRQPALLRAQHHLERPTEPAVGNREVEERIAPSGAHRAEVAQPEPGPPPDFEREHAVRDARVQRPRARNRAAGAEHEIGVARRDEIGDERKIRAVERAVAVHEADDIGGRRAQAGEARGAEAALFLDDDARAKGEGDVGSSVDRAVVDDDRVETGRKRPEYAGQGVGFVERRQDDVGHRETVTIAVRRAYRDELTIRETRSTCAAACGRRA